MTESDGHPRNHTEHRASPGRRCPKGHPDEQARTPNSWLESAGSRVVVFRIGGGGGGLGFKDA